jgi:hypothetical protein
MLTEGTIVRIYYNLHKHCLSIQTRTEQGWRVTQHLYRIQIRNARFLVLKSGRDKVRQEKRKNVHAFVLGSFCSQDSVSGVPVSYNPYRWDSFVRLDTESPIEYADTVYLEGKKIWAVLT